MITALLMLEASTLGALAGWVAYAVTAGRSPLTSDQLRAQTKDWQARDEGWLP